MTSPLVFTKDTLATTISVPLSFSLPGDFALSAALVRVSPTTSPALAVGTIVVPSGGLTLNVPLNGGTEGTSYGVEIQVTTNQAQVFTVLLAVLVKSDLTVPYLDRNPNAFQTLIGSIEAGEAALGNALFALPPESDVSTGSIEWDVLDQHGTIYSRGNAFSYSVSLGLQSTIVSGQAVINVPSDMMPTLDGQTYQIRWALVVNGVVLQYSSESLTVTGRSSIQQGTTDAVEMAGDIAVLSIVVPRLYPSMTMGVYFGNTERLAPVPVPFNRRVASGFLYQISLDTSALSASLEPYSIQWKYQDQVPGPSYREAGRLYLLNPSILNAVSDIRQFVARSRATTMMLDDTIFDDATIVSWLRRGRDTFNAAGGLITDFTMTNANGGIREFWLMYSEVAMLRSQYLAEGEKAFDFQGQSVSLNVDKSQFYQGAADSLQSQLDQQVVPFKKTLSIRGVTAGDGSSSASSGLATSFGVVGVSYNAMSPAYPTFRPGLR